MKPPVEAITKCGSVYLSDGDGLLFHHLMDGCAVSVGHLVKLINAADALISQNQGSSFQGHLSCQRVAHHCRRQTNTRRPTTCCVLA